ncbi:YopX family protein [uncultured Campylobacter sp.]|uniref:YopX family protein n=1 Tax=uncultured Campylobacter sp. TaxID=218934 RepID=UPI0028EF9C80|nr:YopX family protein [uncultured Campylobacter sp.]
MREIKFKAYYKADKRIYEVLYLDFANNELGLWDEETEVDFECSFEDVELMQYTGLKDQNNAEIYESYIVKFDPQSPCGDEFYNPRDGEIGEVILDFGSFVVRPIDKKREDLRFSLSELGDWVVVGNIYENKILIGGKNEPRNF